MLKILFHVGAFAVLVTLIVKCFIKILTRWDRSYTCLVGKTAIVTGANTGIGYFTALDFAKRGARVILACRDKTKAENARNCIISETNNNNVKVRLVDLTSLQSVRNFCNDINATESRLDILVNNAGGFLFGDHLTEDNLQITWQTNQLAPFLLTHLLIGKLKQTPNSRIVIVASVAAKLENLTVNDVNAALGRGIRTLTEFKTYSLTKLANILFARELDRRLCGSGPTVNVLHPGAIRSQFLRRNSLLSMGSHLIYKTSEEGAQTSIYCAVSKDLEGVSGKLFDECRQIGMFKSCADMSLALKVWEKSEELVKLTSEEKIKFSSM